MRPSLYENANLQETHIKPFAYIYSLVSFHDRQQANGRECHVFVKLPRWEVATRNDISFAELDEPAPAIPVSNLLNSWRIEYARMQDTPRMRGALPLTKY